LGSFTSFPPSRRVRFALRAELPAAAPLSASLRAGMPRSASETGRGRGARCPVEPLLSSRPSFQRVAERWVPSENTILRAAHTGMCADAFWRVAKAGTEESVEVRNIGKASLQGDVANTNIEQVLRRQERERMF
jgi:hypothetical protein